MNCNHEIINNNFICSNCNQDINYMLDTIYIDSDDKECVLKLDSDGLYELYRCTNNNCGSFAYILSDYINREEIAKKWHYTFNRENFYILDINKRYTLEKYIGMHDYHIIEEIINEFKTNNLYQGYYCIAVMPGRGCNGAWDLDIYLYIKSNDIVYRYMSNDCSCNGFDDDAFLKSQTVLNKDFYNREREYFNNALPNL